MTAKQQLRERVEALSEQEAAETLRLLDLRADPVARFFDDAPLEDEHISDEEEAAVQEAREERLDPQVRRRVLSTLKGLIADPPQGDIKRLAGSDELRLRVGDHRVRFTRDPATRTVIIQRVLPRGRAYGD